MCALLRRQRRVGLGAEPPDLGRSRARAGRSGRGSDSFRAAAGAREPASAATVLRGHQACKEAVLAQPRRFTAALHRQGRRLRRLARRPLVALLGRRAACTSCRRRLRPLIDARPTHRRGPPRGAVVGSSPPTWRTSRTRAAARARGRRCAASARSGRAASTPHRPEAGGAAAARASGRRATDARRSGRRAPPSPDAARPRPRSCDASASGTQPRQRSSSDGSASIASAPAYATAAMCSHRLPSSHEHARPSSNARGTSGSLQSTVIRCSRCTDCRRPAIASSSGKLPRARATIAVQIRGGTGSAVSFDRAAVDLRGERALSTSISPTPPSRASTRPRSATAEPSSRTTAVAKRRAHAPLPTALAHAASSSIQSGESATAARIAPMSSSPSQSSERAVRSPSRRARASTRAAGRSAPRACRCR